MASRPDLITMLKGVGVPKSISQPIKQSIISLPPLPFIGHVTSAKFVNHSVRQFLQPASHCEGKD